MKYIFVAGAPGSKWSSVVKNIYYSPSINNSDYSDLRTYYHDAEGTMNLMHIGAYFDPGMEFDIPENMNTLSKIQAEQIFDSAFNSPGENKLKIIKSHIFSYHENIEYLKSKWPENPIVLVYRNNDSCLGWWVRCGHFNITYPKYDSYYKNLYTMSQLIDRQNKGILESWKNYQGKIPQTNLELAEILKIKTPLGYFQDYNEKDIKVKVIL
jgi:hypothetical protein